MKVFRNFTWRLWRSLAPGTCVPHRFNLIVVRKSRKTNDSPYGPRVHNGACRLYPAKACHFEVYKDDVLALTAPA